MKKLSILVALILCVTIGGVSATWVYPGNDIGRLEAPVSNNMGDVTFSGSMGTYSLVSNDMALIINQDGNQTFNTMLTYSGNLVFTFTPAANISEAQLDAALNATVSVMGTDVTSAVYGSEQIWAFDQTKTVSLTEADWNEESGVYTCTFACSRLSETIKLAKVFNLPTYDKFKTFSDAHKHAVFNLHVNANTDK